jgi:short-subunit dehydrogenase
MSENQKKIWITGASSGIGKALAEKFSKEKWEVAISARRDSILNEMAKKENITAFPLDVTNKQEVENVFNKIIKDFNDIDICVFCSAVYNRKTEKEINVDQIKKTIDVNFLGSVNCVKAVEKYLKTKKKGQIAIVSSIAAYRGLPNSSGYGPSKAALTNFTESIYFDFKKYNVKIKLISPGFIKTPMTDTNEFPMPFIKTVEFAADKIYKGLLESSAFEIHFPKELTLFLKFLRILPYRIYLFIVDKLVKR